MAVLFVVVPEVVPKVLRGYGLGVGRVEVVGQIYGLLGKVDVIFGLRVLDKMLNSHIEKIFVGATLVDL